MELRFYCKELGTFRLCSVGTYRLYEEAYPDMIRIDDQGQPILFGECIEHLLSK